MYNQEVFYPHFPFCLLYLHNKAAMYVSRNTEVHLCNYVFSTKTINITYSKMCVCSLRYPACNANAPHSHLSAGRD